MPHFKHGQPLNPPLSSFKGSGPRRDRSRSLCVDRVTPLLPKFDQKGTPSLGRRGSASGIVGIFHTTNMLLWCHPATLAESESPSSSTTDLAARRGVFSRRRYGSVEMLASCDSEGSESLVRRFRVENGEQVEKDEWAEVWFQYSAGKYTDFLSPDEKGNKYLILRNTVYGSPSTPVLENPEYQTRWYFKFFLGKLHQNYVGADSEKTPFFLSVVLTDANSQGVQQYRAILWRKTGAQKICLSHSPGKPLTVKSILSNFQNMDKIEKGPKEIFSPEIQKMWFCYLLFFFLAFGITFLLAYFLMITFYILVVVNTLILFASWRKRKNSFIFPNEFNVVLNFITLLPLARFLPRYFYSYKISWCNICR